MPEYKNELCQNYPNPFNPETTIRYSLQNDCNVKIEIFNIKGQLVSTLVDGHQNQGFHTVVWDGTNDNQKEMTSGIFFYRINTDDFSEVKKMLLIK